MVIPLKEVTEELRNKVEDYTRLFYTEDAILDSDLVKYCIGNSLVVDSRIDLLKKEYNI